MPLNPLLDLLTGTGVEYTFNPEYQYELISEESGNKLFIKGKSILLKLASENKPRAIGTIDSEKQTIWLTRNREKHLHRVTSSYGFNFKLFTELKSLKNVILQDDIETFNIPIDIIHKGKLQHFKVAADGNRYEVQLYVHLSILKRYSEKK